MRCAPLLAVFLAVGHLAAGPAVAESAPLEAREGWVVTDTDQSFQDLNQRLDAAIKSAEMGLVTQASASAGAAGQGITIPGNRVVGVYRNDFARRMLEASLAAGIEAPIRFYVVEEPDGTATLAYKTPSTVFAPYMEEGGEALAKLASELDAIFEEIATEATAAAP